MLGICNGFQILTEARLLPGALRPNESLSFVCRDVGSTSQTEHSPFTSRCRRGRAADNPRQARRRLLVRRAGRALDELDAAGQILLRYAPGENPNGSVADVAGVVQRGAETSSA